MSALVFVKVSGLVALGVLQGLQVSRGLCEAGTLLVMQLPIVALNLQLISCQFNVSSESLFDVDIGGLPSLVVGLFRFLFHLEESIQF